MKVKFLIIGAGPSGLSLALALKKRGETSFLVVEKENEAGGLCRSVQFDGAALDTGGGHILDVRRPEVLDFVFSFLPKSEWNFYERNTKIVVGQHRINYPFEANIWQFPIDEQIEYLQSIARAAMHQKEKPERFTEWIYWKFGDKIADDYMLPYNSKIWSCDLNTLGTYWLEKLPDVSFRETLLSCLKRQACGSLPGHAQFYYPKHFGYGEVFLRMACALSEKIKYNYPVQTIDTETRTVNDEIQAEIIINTAPWHSFADSLREEAQQLIARLKYTSVDIDFYPEPSDTDAHWTYYADPTLSFHRKIHRDNIIDGSRGHWTETNSKRRAQTGLAHFENEYAYPLNTIDKPQAIKDLLSLMRKQNIIGLGRWGEWEHFNSDVVIEKGLSLGKELAN